MTSSVLTILVTYNTEVETLRANLEGFSSQSEIVLCDNSTSAATRDEIAAYARTEHLHYLPMEGNLGIACAQNRGIELARKLGSEFLLFLDDDSCPSSDMLPRLIESYESLASSGRKVGAVGAIAISRTGKCVSNVPPGAGKVISCTKMMSSGSLIPMQVIDAVGMMEESLFIGFVDFEWGWRAHARGYELYLVNEAYFSHSLGVGTVDILGLKMKVPSPIRHYYEARNVLRMLPRNYVPWKWRCRQIPVLLARTVLFGLFVFPRCKRLSYMLRGVMDGINGRSGIIQS